MPKQPEVDLSLIGQVVPPENGAALALFQKEVETYAASDDEDDVAYERKIKRAFHARELQQIDAIVESRKAFANKIFVLVVCWLVATGVVILLSGFKLGGFSLDGKVLLALIGGTTLNVLGIFTIVANFLFPKNGHSIFSRAKGADSVKVPSER
jgi:hypothetical protein